MKHASRLCKAALFGTLPLVAGGDVPARADEDAPNPLKDRLYFYSGLDVARDSAYGWAGAAWAPFASMDREGLRLRVQGGGGRYRYKTPDVPGGWNWGTGTEGEMLAGWQFLAGPQALALYGGVNVVNNTLDMPDPWNPDQGTQIGGKVVAEWYARIGENWIATAAGSFSSADRSSSARATIARALPGGWELGVEGSAYNDRISTEAKGGLFVAAPLWGRTFRLAGGWRWSDDSDPGMYGTLSLFMPY